jgi:glycine cleavage system H protein
MNIPDNLKYTIDHEWVKIEDDIATIGITEFAQGELGDVIFVELPEVDDEFESQETFGTVEAVKTVADLLLPISGKIIKINESLEDSPDNVNTDCYGEGWIIKIEISDASELDNLLTSDQYKEHI